MGIGTTIKGALRSNSRRLSTSGPGTPVNSANAVERRTSLATDFSPAYGVGTGAKGAEPQLRSSTSGANKEIDTTEAYSLPSGAGPGTTGKPGPLTDQTTPANNAQNPTDGNFIGTGEKFDHGVTDHRGGHIDSSIDAMPSERTSEDTVQLNPVIHEHVRHVETEEVQRIKQHERHIHHIQHHAQPVVASSVSEEKHHENIHPVTHIRENHVNKSEEAALLEGQMHQHHNTIHHSPKERSVIDKGMVVNEHVHHHVHHIVQPIIQKEIVDQHRIHTTIPIHEITHEAPVIHQSRTHDAMPVERFMNHGGSLDSAVQPKDVSAILLPKGPCVREVDGAAEQLEKDLRLDDVTTSANGDLEAEGPTRHKDNIH